MTIQVARVVVQVAEVEIEGQSADEVRAFVEHQIESGHGQMLPLDWTTTTVVHPPAVHQVLSKAS